MLIRLALIYNVTKFAKLDCTFNRIVCPLALYPVNIVAKIKDIKGCSQNRQ